VTFTPQMLAELEAQRAYFASDEHIRERSAVWRDASIAECLAATADACREAESLMALKTPAEIERLLEPEPLPEDTIAILEALQR
jgi:hypothetical protein